MIDIQKLQNEFMIWLDKNLRLRCYCCREKMTKVKTPTLYPYVCVRCGWYLTKDAYFQLLANQQRTGVTEELGELSHVDLKEEQRIREYSSEAQRQDPNRAQRDRIDSLGDMLIYMINYCNLHGISLEEALRNVGLKVLKRDWTKDPEAGGE